MEKFFIVNEGSRLKKDYSKYRENKKTVNELVKEFMIKHGMESDKYYAGNEYFGIVPTEKDLKNFSKSLNSNTELKFFRKNSKVNKDWIATLKEENLTVLHKPMIGIYLDDVLGKFSTRIFEEDNKLYCSINAQYDFTYDEKDFTEIKASEIYKALEK